MGQVRQYLPRNLLTFCRCSAAEFMSYCMDMINKDEGKDLKSGAVGYADGHVIFTPLAKLPEMMHPTWRYATIK